MSKIGFLIPLAFVVAAVYLFLISINGGEHVELLPGHPMPVRFGFLFSGIAVVAAIVVGVEVLRSERMRQSRRGEGSSSRSGKS
jgi:hypothetical protein